MPTPTTGDMRDTYTASSPAGTRTITAFQIPASGQWAATTGWACMLTTPEGASFKLPWDSGQPTAGELPISQEDLDLLADEIVRQQTADHRAASHAALVAQVTELRVYNWTPDSVLLTVDTATSATALGTLAAQGMFTRLPQDSEPEGLSVFEASDGLSRVEVFEGHNGEDGYAPPSVTLVGPTVRDSLRALLDTVGQPAAGERYFAS